MHFNFTNLFETHHSAETFFRNMGVPVIDQTNEVKLLQAISEYISFMRTKPDNIRARALKISKDAFKDLTGEDLTDVAAKYDPSITFDESTDMMPRQKFHVDRDKALNMKMADEILRPDTNDVEESIDPQSFEMVSIPSRYITTDDLHSTGQGVPQEELRQYANTEVLNDLVGGAFVTDPSGNVEYAGADVETCDDFVLDETWFIDATQDLVDRTSTGECWCDVVHDLAQRFAGFFDGSYHAYEFAAAAFARRAMDMGMIEQQMMIESFDTTGSFDNLQPTIGSTIYRGHQVSLNPHDYDRIKILHISL